MARDTRRRITETCLLLFNEAGEPAVSTNQIADAVDISPGNLYYHFRRKSDIVTDLFDLYRTRITPLLEVPEQAVLHVDDAWLLLHLMFETVWDYRFIYRDLDSLLGRYDSLRARLQRVIRGKENALRRVCDGLVRSGSMFADDQETRQLSRNMNLVLCYWLSYQNAMGSQQPPGRQLGNGVFHVFSLLLPYLEADAREQLGELARAYVS